MSLIKEYIRYLKDNPKGYWFKAKCFGWGWVPARWQGWVVIVVFVVLLVWNAMRIDAASHSASDTVRPLLIETFGLVALLLLVCWKTGERPHWMWGVPKKGEPEQSTHNEEQHRS